MDIFHDSLVSIASIAVVLLYGWSLGRHFISKKMPAGTMVISAVVTLTSLIFLALLWSGKQPLLATIAGLMIEAAGVWLFWAAIVASRAARLKMAFDSSNPHGLITEGPYSRLRHPFYTSYLIFWLGWGVATWSAWAVLPLAAIVVIYVAAALGEERKFRNTPMADQYEAYRLRTGFFWPRFWA